MKEIVFRDTEIRMDTDADGLCVAIPLDLIRQRMEAISTLSDDHVAVERQYADLLAGLTWRPWVKLNFSQTKKGTRSAGMYAKLLGELASLKKKYGADALNSALLKVWQPKQASIPYLRAILRNEAASATASAGENTGGAGAWKTVLSAISNISACYTAKFGDTRIHPAIPKMGGWDKFRGMTLREIHALRNTFLRVYAEATPERQDRPPDADRGRQMDISDLTRGIGNIGREREPGPETPDRKPPEKLKFSPLKKSAGNRAERAKAEIRRIVASGEARAMEITKAAYPKYYAEVMREVGE